MQFNKAGNNVTLLQICHVLVQEGDSMYKKPMNKKSEYTMQKITEALFSLMEHDSFSEITILQICQEAQVSRAAYYRNFETKEDIIEYAIIEKIEHFMERITNKTNLIFEDSNFIDAWIAEKDFFILLNRQNLFGQFTLHLHNYFRKYLCEISPNYNEQYDYLAGALSFGTVAFLVVWVQHGCKETPEELLQIIDKTRNTMMRREIQL